MRDSMPCTEMSTWPLEHIPSSLEQMPSSLEQIPASLPLEQRTAPPNDKMKQGEGAGG